MNRGAPNVQQAAHACAGAFADELARSGVEHVCLCPGSRSTPLAMMFAAHPGLTVWTHIDERSAGFFALGMAKALGKPVALVCTSGTAAANFLPAVVEAFYGRVPLLVLTADRPRELRDAGAPQTIDQVRLFGGHVKWFVDMPVPEADTFLLRHARTVACRAVAAARSAPAGPVHINFPFREPLVPLPPADPHPGGSGAAAAWRGRDEGNPYAELWDAAGIDENGLKQLLRMIRDARRGLFVCGPDVSADLSDPLFELSGRLGWPVLADPLSGLRAAAGAPGAVVDAYDAFLRHAPLRERLVPDLVVRFGAMPVSKPLTEYLDAHAAVPQVVIDAGAGWPGSGWRDPILNACAMVRVEPKELCRRLLSLLEQADNRSDGSLDGGPENRGVAGPGSKSGPRGSWRSAWLAVNETTRRLLRSAVDALAEPFEGRVFQELADLLPAGSALYVGNSMPVRDMDAFFPAVARPVRVFGNRGASGIDGVVSSALGVSAAWPGPVVLVVGDLSFYHDLNGLLAAKRHGLSLTIVVINNDGGGIFSFLPQASYPEHFEELFGTPIGLDFRPAVEMYGGTFTRVPDWEGFREAVRTGIAGTGLHVVELVTRRDANARQHRLVWDAVAAGLSDWPDRLGSV
ncbi:MAG: 2-succinyl-5-enolpyruvyl-6-hydroxy-3-cyclohexene-1-carboxylic-acid synthase [Firmicutes bacterium]|nr:2-succinyl-5-enolpyruvyl-6-hydroxy-3-cyclohexene-1-carboxylic-acid synthase [Bacillota bacterium]